MKIEKEPFSLELLGELMPLAQACWEESTRAKAETCAFYGDRDFKIEPDLDNYRRMQESGILTILTMRDKGELVGYLVGVLYRSWHHTKVLCAHVDTAYVKPAARAYTAVMIEKFERDMTERGVGIIGWPAHENGPVYKVLLARGYVGDDLVMEKRLCASQRASSAAA